MGGNELPMWPTLSETHLSFASPSSPSYDIPIPLTNKRDIVLKLQKNTH